jgi:hypothetical protein
VRYSWRSVWLSLFLSSVVTHPRCRIQLQMHCNCIAAGSYTRCDTPGTERNIRIPKQIPGIHSHPVTYFRLFKYPKNQNENHKRNLRKIYIQMGHTSGKHLTLHINSERSIFRCFILISKYVIKIRWHTGLPRSTSLNKLNLSVSNFYMFALLSYIYQGILS